MKQVRNKPPHSIVPVTLLILFLPYLFIVTLVMGGIFSEWKPLAGRAAGVTWFAGAIGIYFVLGVCIDTRIKKRANSRESQKDE